MFVVSEYYRRLALGRSCVEEHQDLAGVDRDADLKILVRRPHPVADRECGPHGALRVVLVCDRGSESAMTASR